MEEIWKDIKFTDFNGTHYDYTGLYQVSSLGRVKSLEKEITTSYRGKACASKREEKFLKTGIKYGKVTLFKENKRQQFYVHRLVAFMFVENPKPTEWNVVNHKDENPSNNIASNLEWCDIKYNVTYGTAIQRRTEKTRGENHYRHGREHEIVGGLNPQARKVICIETGQVFDCMREASDWCGLKSASSISAVCLGVNKTAGGYHWEYYNEGEVSQLC